jgi:hypothetical protein
MIAHQIHDAIKSRAGNSADHFGSGQKLEILRLPAFFRTGGASAPPHRPRDPGGDSGRARKSAAARANNVIVPQQL